jgi:CheY-like chemotaxis protein
MGDTKYCLCCNEEVPFTSFERNERIEITCLYCGFPLDIKKLYEPKEPVEKGYALIADDSKHTRKIIENRLKEKKYSDNVLSFENGLELFSAYSKLLEEKKPVDIAIIDLNMPVMDGLTAARMIRSFETQNNHKAVPIIFFSAEKADDNFKKQMESLDPANYMNKGNDTNPDALASRVESLITYLIDQHSKGT